MDARRRQQLENQLSAYLDDELTPQQRQAVEALLAESPEARQLLADLRAIAAGLANLPRARASEDLMESIRTRLERRALLGDEAPAMQPPARPARFPFRWVALAASLAIASFGLYSFWQLHRMSPTAAPQQFAWNHQVNKPAAPAEAPPAVQNDSSAQDADAFVSRDSGKLERKTFVEEKSAAAPARPAAKPAAAPQPGPVAAPPPAAPPTVPQASDLAKSPVTPAPEAAPVLANRAPAESAPPAPPGNVATPTLAERTPAESESAPPAQDSLRGVAPTGQAAAMAPKPAPSRSSATDTFATTVEKAPAAQALAKAAPAERARRQISGGIGGGMGGPGSGTFSAGDGQSTVVELHFADVETRRRAIQAIRERYADGVVVAARAGRARGDRAEPAKMKEALTAGTTQPHFGGAQMFFADKVTARKAIRPAQMRVIVAEPALVQRTVDQLRSETNAAKVTVYPPQAQPELGDLSQAGPIGGMAPESRPAAQRGVSTSFDHEPAADLSKGLPATQESEARLGISSAAPATMPESTLAVQSSQPEAEQATTAPAEAVLRVEIAVAPPQTQPAIAPTSSPESQPQ